jgi:hypothetical protein
VRRNHGWKPSEIKPRGRARPKGAKLQGKSIVGKAPKGASIVKALGTKTPAGANPGLEVLGVKAPGIALPLGISGDCLFPREQPQWQVVEQDWRSVLFGVHKSSKGVPYATHCLTLSP